MYGNYSKYGWKKKGSYGKSKGKKKGYSNYGKKKHGTRTVITKYKW